MVKISRQIRYLLKRHPVLYRIRFAWITQLGSNEVFCAECSNKYCVEKEIPGDFRRVASKLQLNGESAFLGAKRIAFDLSHDHRPGRGLGCDSVEALRTIYNGGGGTCSDYSQVYLGLCIAAGIKAREWGVCDDFRKTTLGHTFNEIFSTEYNKWVFIDTFNSIYAADKNSRDPLSVTEIVDLCTALLPGQIEIHYIDRQRIGQEGHSLTDLYLKPNNVFFLMSNNRIFKQDRVLRWANIVPLPLLHSIMIMLGIYQRFEVYSNQTNRLNMLNKLRVA